MTSAREMFEKLGYNLEKRKSWLKCGDDTARGRYEYIEYLFEDGSYMRTITFNPIMKTFKIKDTHDYSEFELTDDFGKVKQEVVVNIGELNAINQQMKEFGWIDA